MLYIYTYIHIYKLERTFDYLFTKNNVYNNLEFYLPKYAISQYFKLRKKENYLLPKSNKQIEIIKRKPVEYYKLAKLISDVIKNPTPLIIKNILSPNNDKDIYNNLKNFDLLNNDNFDTDIVIIKTILNLTHPNKKFKNLLHISNNKYQTQILQKEFDIDNNVKLKNINKTSPDITILSLNVKKTKELLNKLSNNIKSGGILILKEYDVMDSYDAILSDIDQLIYKVKDENFAKILKEFEREYYNFIELSLILKEYNFKWKQGLHYNNSIKFSSEPARKIYQLYEKI